MTRRKLVALVAAAVLFTLGLAFIGAGLFVMHTTKGRGLVRDFVVPRIAGAVHRGSIHVGKFSGDFINGFEIDTLAIRDERNELFLSTGRIRVWWNWRDLIDNRLYISKATVEHPFIHIVQHENYKWNYKEIFEDPNKKPDIRPKNPNARSITDFIVLDSVSARDGTFLLTLPWHPDDQLRGAARDSAIRYHLATPSKMVSKTFDGYGRTYAWRNGSAVLSHVRLADPDSDRFGRVFKIATLSVDEYEPTFKFRNVSGTVKHLGDSLWLDLPRFELPASRGYATGKVWWGSDRPVRYAIDIRGEQVALDDVNWVYPTLPHTGGGSLNLLIRNDPANERIIDFRIQNMDVRSTNSHLIGDMWFGTGARVLLVRNVNLRAEPITFDLIRTLNGKPFPYDWRGNITGTVRARGGPLTNFVVDEAHGRFDDAHVRGAVSRFSGKGELDILVPALTAFHSFDVNAEVVDLRTIEFLNPAFPRLGGVVSGTATLDSSWLDVRFSNAHLAHQDGPGEPSRFSGSGRVTTSALMHYDVSLNAEPVNIGMLARSKPFETLKEVHGLFSGPLRLRGTAEDLEVAATLQGPGGAFSYEGRADLDSLGGYAAHGGGQFSNVLLPTLFARTNLPDGPLSGHYDVSLDSILLTQSSIRGTVEMALDRTTIEGVRVAPAELKLRFADGRMLIDSLRLRTDAFRVVEARGGIGLPGGTADSLRFRVEVDSLGGLRPLISTVDSAARSDSLSGSARIIGVARGTFDALALDGEIFGSQLYYNKDRGDSLYARFNVRNALTNPTGAVLARVDSVTVAGIALDTLGGTLTLIDSTHRPFTFGASTRNGATMVAGGTWAKSGIANLITADSLRLMVGESRWSLASPARLTIDSTLVRLDSAVLRNSDSAFVAVSANVPDNGSASAQLRAVNVPLKDIGSIAQIADTLFGVGNATITAGGTKLHPVIDASVDLSAIRWRGVDVDHVVAAGRYNDFRATGDARVVRNGQNALTANASWPMDVTLLGIKPRNDSVRVDVTADTTDLAILAPLFKGTVDSVKGRLFGDVHVSGTTTAKVFEGGVTIRDGQALVRPAGVTYRAINGAFTGGVNAAGQDSINVVMSARTSNRDQVRLNGWVANLAPQRNQTTRFDFTLDADSLHAFNRRSLADVYISTTEPVRLRGTREASVLTGALNVDRGAIYLADPDLARKLSVDLLAENALTVTSGSNSILTDLMTNLRIDQVPVTIGQEFRLRSTEADVRLTGQLFVVKSSNPTRVVAATGQLVPGLSLEGQLTTVSGTYNVNLGLVQREFSVLSGGTVVFDGGDPERPYVDIKAKYNVNRFSDRPLGVIVNLRGRIPNPTIEFSSDADYTIAQSDLLSYLIIGQPGFDFAANAQASQLLASVLSPTISAVTADRLRGILGSTVDLQVEFGDYRVGNAGQNPFSSQNIVNYLYTASISAERRVYRDLYVGLNTGICGIKEIGDRGLTGVGAKVEYRFSPKLSLQASYDPPSESRTSCLNQEYQLQQGLIGLVKSPGQFAFSVRHSWRF